MAGTLKNFYETLGVPRSATDEQIKTAYRKLILKFHPDKNVGDVYFEDWSKKIIEAFEVLSDPQLRAEYDQVYDEHRRAAKRNFQEPVPPPEPDPQPAAAAPEPAARAPEEEEPQVHAPDAEPVPAAAPHATAMAMIREELPAYLTAKQEYLKAVKAAKDQESRRPPVKKSYRLPLIFLCLLVIAVSVVWIVRGPAKEPVAAVPEGTVSNIAGKFIVAADRAYFYRDPQNQVRTNEYLTKGNKILVSKKYRNFYYAVFQSIANPDYKLTGWIKEEDLQPYNE